MMISQHHTSSSSSLVPLVIAGALSLGALSGAYYWNHDHHGGGNNRSISVEDKSSKNTKKKTSHQPLKRRFPPTRQDAKILQPFLTRRVGGGEIKLKNRVIRAAAFGGSKIDELIRTHTEVAKGGVAMTTVAYASVSKDGCTFDSQILLSPPSINDEILRKELKQLTQAVQQAGAKISIQLTHGGFFADKSVTGIQQVAPSPCFNAAGFNWAKEMTTVDLERVANDFVQAAKLAETTGFDAIELHCGHGYLLSQFLSPATNWRKDQYGGSAENRVRYPLEILQRIRQATTASNLLIVVKMNLQDGFHGGMTGEDAIYYAKAFAQHADLLVLSGGFTSRNGFYMLRGRVPLWEMAKAMGLWTNVKGLAVLLLGKWLVPEIPFEECFFRQPALAILNAITNEKCAIGLVGGITSLSAMEGLMDDGFAFVQIARGLIQNPHLVKDIEEALLPPQLLPPKSSDNNKKNNDNDNDMEDIRSNCIHCNQCVVTTLNPTMEMICPVKV